MSALVCLYVIGIAALVAAGAAAIEWGVQGRIPARYVWTVAMFGALLVPPLALVQHARTTARPAVSTTETTFVEVVHLGRAATSAMGAREPGSPLNTLRDEYRSVTARISDVSARTIIVGWIVASLALLGWIGAGVAYWHRARGEWEETELDGISVHLSAETGPAVLGVISQRIVLPAWAQALAPEYRRLMLAHECEHIAARDPQRLALALTALVLMPWNPVLWWCAARMRRAIEMDCDARVLRQHPSPREYGYLLLQVAARGRNAGPLAMPLVGLLRLPSELELRLRAMTRPRTLTGRTALIGAACAVAAVSAAFTAPVPRVTRTAIRNLKQAARVRLARGEAFVGTGVGRVGGKVLRLDSATVGAGLGVVHGKVLELRGLPAVLVGADTIPRAVAEDSIQRLERQLAEQARHLDSIRTRADSLDAEMQLMRTRALALDSMNLRARIRLDSAARDPNGKQMRALRRLNAALAHYYPDVSFARVAAPGGIWFLADSSGKVLETRRVGPGPAVGFPAPAVNGKDVDFVTVRTTSPGRQPHFSVVWMQLKR